MEPKLLLGEHVDLIYEFEKGQLSEDLSPIEQEMKSWNQPWRRESLEHYAGLGWSFISQDNNKIQGYILAQPILFFNNWTQTLWVEHLSFQESEVGHQLVDVVIRWAKNKHLQKVIVNSASERSSFVAESFQGFKEGAFIHLSTTKLSES